MSIEESNAEALAAHIDHLAEVGEGAIGTRYPESDTERHEFILAIITEHDALREQHLKELPSMADH